MASPRCFFHDPLGMQCSSRASEVRGNFVFCELHARIEDARLPPGRTLVTNAQRLGDETGARDDAAASALNALKRSAILAFGDGAARPRGVSAPEPGKWVAHRLRVRYRRTTLGYRPGVIRWRIAGAQESGATASSIVQRALEGLAGVDDDDEFLIRAQSSALTGPIRALRGLQKALDASIGDAGLRMEVAERAITSAVWSGLRRNMEQTQLRVAAALSELESAKRGHRPRNVASDAAVILLAGCWWLVVGSWPTQAKDGKGRFHDWAIPVLKEFRSDLASGLRANSMMHALSRQHHLYAEAARRREPCGPWLANRNDRG